jgi:hypothetical protein
LLVLLSPDLLLCPGLPSGGDRIGSLQEEGNRWQDFFFQEGDFLLHQGIFIGTLPNSQLLQAQKALDPLLGQQQQGDGM